MESKKQTAGSRVFRGDSRSHASTLFALQFHLFYSHPLKSGCSQFSTRAGFGMTRFIKSPNSGTLYASSPCAGL